MNQLPETQFVTTPVSAPAPQLQTNKSPLPAIALTAFITVLVAGTGGYLLAKTQTPPAITTEQVVVTQPVQTESTPTVDTGKMREPGTTQPETMGMQIYTHDQFQIFKDSHFYGFTINYPSSWQLQEYRNDKTYRLELTFTLENNDFFTIKQEQEEVNSSNCVFDNEVAEGMAVKYEEYTSLLNTALNSEWRIAKVPPKMGMLDGLTHVVCSTDIDPAAKDYYSTTHAGEIKIYAQQEKSLPQIMEVLRNITFKQS